ncbi:MAG: rhodanese-related sulfurtransferase [Leptospiraceae bacterium]|nr:rhodanese-related sulfurtransferase [Leptospiraceae bacterium]
MKRKFNLYDDETLKHKLESETFARINLSFYRYVILENPSQTRDELYEALASIQVLGRIYLAKEGINAQISVPDFQLEKLSEVLNTFTFFENMYLNIAVESREEAFIKLVIKVRSKIVADGLEDLSFDVTNVGTHLTAEEFNHMLEDKDTICIDMRNSYESEIGHFQGAILPEAETFREELPEVLDFLQESGTDKKILLYCTGGIRCEKASAFIKHHGYKDVYQLRGGIISYAQEIKSKNLPSKFLGKNFVFDSRLSEKITEDVLAKCHICGTSCDTHTNCMNAGCHVLMIQCPSCSEKLNACCSEECKDILQLPESLQKDLRRKVRIKSSLVPFTKSRAKKRSYNNLTKNDN